MYLRLVLIICLFYLKPSSAVMIGLCPSTPPIGVIPCDAACFGSAAINMGLTMVQDQASLSQAYLDNTSKWIEVNNTYVESLQTYSDDKMSTSSDRTTALDGVSKKVTLSLDLFAMAIESSYDAIVQNYVQSARESRLSYQVVDTFEQFNSPTASFKGETLIGKSQMYRESLSLQVNKRVGIDVATSPKGKMSAIESSILLSKSENQIQLLELLAQDQITTEELLFISSQVGAMNLINENNTSLDVKLEGKKQELFVSLLLDSYYVLDTGSSNLLKDVQALIVEEDIRGSLKTMSYKELLVDSAVSNTLINVQLNEYLKLKRKKNVIQAIL